MRDFYLFVSGAIAMVLAVAWDREEGIVSGVIAFTVTGILTIKVLPAMWNSFRDRKYDNGASVNDDHTVP